jgi:hypothetical protein
MGAGNYLPYYDNYQMVYVDHPDLDWSDEDLAQDDWQQWNQELKLNIEHLLPKSFWEVSKRGEHGLSIEHQNHLLYAGLADNQNSTALVIARRDDINDQWGNLEGLADRHLLPVANKLFNGLKSLGYQLYVRCGPWMSGRYEGAQ